MAMASQMMKVNAKKCHLIFNSEKDIENNEKIIKSSLYEELLGVTFINFNKQIIGLCKEAQREYYLLARASPYISLPKKCLHLNTSFRSQFNHCPYDFMFQNNHQNDQRPINTHLIFTKEDYVDVVMRN